MTKPQNLALFDLDHTLLPLDSDYHRADFLARSGHVDDPETALRRNDELMQRYIERNLSAEESHRLMLELIANRLMTQLHQSHDALMETIILPAHSDHA